MRLEIMVWIFVFSRKFISYWWTLLLEISFFYMQSSDIADFKLDTLSYDILRVCTVHCRSSMVKNLLGLCLLWKRSSKRLYTLRVCTGFVDGKKTLKLSLFYRASKERLHTLSIEYYFKNCLFYRNF